MSKFTQSRPRQDVRVKSWTKGRLANLRLMITQLESALDSLGVAAVVQSSARKFNDFIPFILDLDIDAGYRQFTVNFSIPPGINPNHPDRQLLFYEVQHDSNIAFPNPTIIDDPQRHIIVGGIGIGETRYFRARVINTKFDASRWSSTVTATTSQGVFQQTNLADISTRLISSVGEWQDIITKSYDPFNGAVMVNVQLAVGGVQEDVTVSRDAGGIVTTFFSGPAFVQFRWVRDDGTGDSEFGQRAMLSVRPGFTGKKLGKAPMAFGTFMSEFIRPGEDTFTIKLQATKAPGSEWRGGGSVPRTLEISDPLIFTRNGKIVEVLETL